MADEEVRVTESGIEVTIVELTAKSRYMGTFPWPASVAEDVQVIGRPLPRFPLEGEDFEPPPKTLPSPPPLWDATVEGHEDTQPDIHPPEFHD